MQVYESNIVSLLSRSNVLDSSKVDTNDSTYKAWTTDEVISLSEYLTYCIGMNWIDVSRLNLEEKYVDAQETFEKLVEVIIELVDGNQEFQKKFYKYMLLSDVISGNGCVYTFVRAECSGDSFGRGGKSLCRKAFCL